MLKSSQPNQTSTLVFTHDAPDQLNSNTISIPSETLNRNTLFITQKLQKKKVKTLVKERKTTICLVFSIRLHDPNNTTLVPCRQIASLIHPWQRPCVMSWSAASMASRRSTRACDWWSQTLHVHTENISSLRFIMKDSLCDRWNTTLSQITT